MFIRSSHIWFSYIHIHKKICGIKILAPWVFFIVSHSLRISFCLNAHQVTLSSNGLWTTVCKSYAKYNVDFQQLVISTKFEASWGLWWHALRKNY